MKKNGFTWLILLGVFAFQSCDKDDLAHPESKEVEKTFVEKYPNASQVEWEKKGNYWIADFYFNHQEMEAWFEKNGTWRMTEINIAFDALPEPVKTAFSSGEYQTWAIDDIDMVERKDVETVYVLETEKGNKEYSLYYSPAGTLIKAVEDTWRNDDNEKYLL